MSYYETEYEQPQERGSKCPRNGTPPLETVSGAFLLTGPKKATPEQIYLVQQWQRQAGKLQQRSLLQASYGVLGFTDSHRDGSSDTEGAAKRLKTEDQDNLALALQYPNSTIPEFSVIHRPGSSAAPM